MDEWTDGQIDGWTDRHMNEKMNELTEEWMMDGLMNK